MAGRSKNTGFSTLDWSEDDELVAFCAAAWEGRPRDQIRRERLAELAQAFCNGDQYVASLPAGNGFRIEPMPVDPDRLHVTANRIGPLAEQWRARVAGGDFDFEAAPAAPQSQQDLDASRTQTALCRYYNDLLDFPKLRSKLVQRIALGGIGFTKVAWDPQAGRELPFSGADLRRWKVPQQVLDALFDQPQAGGVLALGEAFWQNVGLHSVTWGPAGVPFEQAEWVLEACERSRTYLKARWGLRDEDITDAYAHTAQRWYRGVLDRGGSLLYQGPDAELVVTWELWLPRSAAHPQGHLAVIVGEKLVNRRRNRELVNPYDHGRIPYVACQALDDADSPYGKTPLWDAMAIQDQINALWSNMMEAAARFGIPDGFLQEGGTLTIDEMSRGPGGWHYYDGNLPKQLPGLELPATLPNLLDRLYRTMQDMFGINEPSLGRNMTGMRSARQALVLMGSDDVRSGPTVQAVKRWAQDVFQLLLCVLDQCVSDERMIAVRGADNAWERRAFRGGMLAPGSETSGPQRFNVQVRAAGRTRSPAAVSEQVLMLAQAGLWDVKDPEDRRQIFTLLELGDSTDRLNPKQVDVDGMRRDIERLLAGEDPHPQWYQDLTVRQAELLRFLNGTDFPRLAPGVQQRFAVYYKEIVAVQATHALEVGKIAADAQAAWQRRNAPPPVLSAPGGPGPPPAAPPPGLRLPPAAESAALETRPPLAA